jgi:hypothetical protein
MQPFAGAAITFGLAGIAFALAANRAVKKLQTEVAALKVAVDELRGRLESKSK